jgi:hypothetical protein
MNSITEYIDTANHEAAHAVVAASLAGVISADIHSVDGRAGRCRHSGTKNHVHTVAILLGGPVGAWLARGRRGEKFYGGSSDLTAIDEMLTKLHGVNVNEKNRNSFPEFVLGLKLAREILSREWGAVVRCAEWLKAKQNISGRLVHAILVCHKLPLSLGE